MSSLERILVVPDVHRPFHDKRAWDVMIKTGRALKPNRIIVLGDFLDCYGISAHDRDPQRIRQFSSEAKDGREGLDELQDLGAEHLHFHLGNHEDRLRRYLSRKAPELSDFVTIEAALQLKERGCRVTPYMQHSRVGKLYTTHDAGYAGIHAVHLTGGVFSKSVVFGHTHRLAVSYFGSVTGERHFSASLGWLGDEKEATYIPAAKRAQWQHGFGIVRMEKSGNVHLTPIPIVDGRVVLDGKLL